MQQKKRANSHRSLWKLPNCNFFFNCEKMKGASVTCCKTSSGIIFCNWNSRKWGERLRQEGTKVKKGRKGGREEVWKEERKKKWYRKERKKKEVKKEKTKEERKNERSNSFHIWWKMATCRLMKLNKFKQKKIQRKITLRSIIVNSLKQKIKRKFKAARGKKTN